MTGLPGSEIVWGLAVVQVLGLAISAMTRLSEGSRRESLYQWWFMACLLLVGMTTIVSVGFSPKCWMASGTTLAIMVLTVTSDFGRSGRANTREV